MPMSIPLDERAWSKRALAALVLAGAVILAGCAASTVADHMPAAVGGLPGDAPKRPETPPPFPAVHDTPSARAETTLTAAEQKQLEDDLIAASKRASGAASAAGTTRKP
jgi:hypothetical protein